jgi:hypothetical protein
MSAPEPEDPQKGKPPQTDSSDTVICIIEGEEDSTVRPIRPEILRHMRPREQPPPPEQPPAPQKP